MPDIALDFSSQHPDVSDLVAKGVKAILFYSRVSTPPRDYLESVIAAGIGALPIFETAATRSFGGFDAGSNDAAEAEGDLHRLGVPEGVRLYVNMADTPDVAGNEDMIRDYANGFAKSFPKKWRLGAYGPLGALRAAQRGSRRFDALWGVETWHPDGSGNPNKNFAVWAKEPDVVLVQMANVAAPIGGTDANWIVKPDLGAWGGEDDMAISDEQMATLAQWMQDQRDVTLKVLIGDYNPMKDRAVLATWENDTRNQVISALASIKTTGGQLDAKALANAIADALGDGEAKKVADELAARLAN
jgi:hypothetical protein